MREPEGDFVERVLFEDLDISGVMVRLSRSWREMQSRRDYSAPIRALLGELAAVSVLIGSNLKQPGRVSVQLRGDGALSLLLVECTQALRLRGMARAEPVTDSLRLPELFGDGQLTLTMQDDDGRSVYQSIVPLDGETVAEVFEHYLSQSVQHPASLMLAAGQDHAVGLLLQKLPGGHAPCVGPRHLLRRPGLRSGAVRRLMGAARGRRQARRRFCRGPAQAGPRVLAGSGGP